MSWNRKIIHVDMDAFFAAIEQRDNPKWRGKPVIVGGTPEGRGVVSTCSYEAREYGIHSAMPAATARRLCPKGIFVRPDFQKYKTVSRIVKGILRQHAELMESVSVDEAYLDVSSHRLGIEDPITIAELIKQNIHAVTKLTASAGVAPNMFLAKVASDFNKPDGLTVVYPDKVEGFLEDLPIRKIPGVGPVTETKLKKMGLHTCGELARLKKSFLVQKFGKTGAFLYERSQGRDRREVEPYTLSKQYSTERTFAKDIRDLKTLKAKLREFSEEVFEVLKRDGRMGRTVTLKVKYHDFKQITRSQTVEKIPKNWDQIYEVATYLLEKKTKAGQKPVRLVGLGISGLEPWQKVQEKITKDLFGQAL